MTRDTEREGSHGEDRFRQLFEQMLEGFALHEIITDPDGHPIDYRFLEANPAFEELTGLRTADIVGRTVLEVIPEIETQWIARYGRVALTGEPILFEQYFAPLDRYYQVRAYSPAPRLFAVMFTDVSEMRAAAEALRVQHATLRGVMDSVSAPVFSLDREYRYTNFNTAHANVMKALYGAEVRMGASLADLQTVPEDWRAAKANLDRALAGETLRDEGFSGEGLHRQYFEVIHNPIADSDGTVIGVAVIALDTTDQHRRSTELSESREELAAMVEELTAAEEEVRHLNEDLERRVFERTRELETANEELRAARAAGDRFLANMSHELRTPLNSVIGFSGVLLSGAAGDLEPEQQRQIAMINDSGRHLLHIINDMLDLSAIESGRVTLDREGVDAAEVVRSVAASVAPLAAEKAIGIEVDVPDEPVGMRSDPTRLRQVLINLAGNAIKFTDHGTVTLAVSADGDDAVFSVTDAGPGIPPEEIDAIFDAFRQGSAGSLAKAPGVGLGLSISRRLAHMLGGEITVTSAPGEGSTFEFALPRERD